MAAAPVLDTDAEEEPEGELDDPAEEDDPDELELVGSEDSELVDSDFCSDELFATPEPDRLSVR